LPKQAEEDKRKVTKSTKSTRSKTASSKNSKAEKPAETKAVAAASAKKTASKQTASRKTASSKAAAKSKTSKTLSPSAARKSAKSPKAATKTAKASKTKTAAKAKDKVDKAAKPSRKTKKTTAVVDEYSDEYSPKFLNEMKEMLLQMRGKLLEDVTKSVKSESDYLRFDVGDFYDHASNERDRELTLTLSDRERDKLVLIEDALRRINDGTYGYCEMTGDKVGEGRLRAMPFTTLSVEAQDELERSGG